MNHCEGCKAGKVDDKIVEIGEKYKLVEGGIIGALHEVQDFYGYIPTDVQKYLSNTLDVPMADIYGIITFYSRFSLKPKGKYNIQVCMGTACYVKGSEEVIDEFKKELGIKEGQTTEDGKFSLAQVRCIGACGLAPAIVVNEEVYGKMTKEKVKEVLDKYREIK
jgi:NADP-reducing hydrogenase subunit HndA